MKIVAHSVQTLLENRNVRHASGWLTGLISFLVVLFTQIWQHFLLKKMWSSDSTFWLFARRSESLTSLLTFVWVCLITFLNFVVFRIVGLSIELLWMLGGVALVIEARGIYRAFVCVLGDKYNVALFRRSLYYRPLANKA